MPLIIRNIVANIAACGIAATLTAETGGRREGGR